MSQFAEVLAAQKTLEENFLRKMGELESQIQSAGPAKDTVAKIAEEFRSFRELIFSMLGLLRSQISECAKQIDGLETRQRRKTLIFQGLPEVDNEDSKAVILEVLDGKLALKNLSASSIEACYRLGSHGKEHHRPILVKFASTELKASVWKAKTGLRGSKISVKEFLTKARQSAFIKAREHFSMRSCWTQDGVIFIKAADGNRHKVTCMDELMPLIAKYPKAPDAAPSSSGRGVDATGNLKNTTRKC